MVHPPPPPPLLKFRYPLNVNFFQCQGREGQKIRNMWLLALASFNHYIICKCKKHEVSRARFTSKDLFWLKIQSFFKLGLHPEDGIREGIYPTSPRLIFHVVTCLIQGSTYLFEVLLWKFILSQHYTGPIKMKQYSATKFPAP